MILCVYARARVCVYFQMDQCSLLFTDVQAAGETGAYFELGTECS